MSDLSFDDLSGLTYEEMQRRRNILLSRMIAEPIEDPGFYRPNAKLEHLVRESESYIERLKFVVNKLDHFLKLVDLVQTGLAKILINRTVVLSEVRYLPLQNQPSYISKRDSLQGKEWDQNEQCHSMELKLNEISLQLEAFLIGERVRVGLISSNANMFLVSSVDLWQFLENSTRRITVGTNQVFRKSEMPEGLDAVMSDMVDVVAGKAGGMAVMPVFNIFKLVYRLAKTKKVTEHEVEESWSNVEVNVFLASYFEWWSEKDGSRDLVEFICRAEEYVGSQQSEVDDLNDMWTRASDALSKFDQLILQYRRDCVAKHAED